MWAIQAPTALLWLHPSPQIDAVLQLSLGLGTWCRSLLTPGMAILQGQPSWHGTGFWMSGEQGEPEGHQISSCMPPLHSQSSSPAAAVALHRDALTLSQWSRMERGPCLWKRGYTNIQGCWQEGGLVRQRIKQQKHQWFVQPNSQTRRGVKHSMHTHTQTCFRWVLASLALGCSP